MQNADQVACRADRRATQGQYEGTDESSGDEADDQQREHDCQKWSARMFLSLDLIRRRGVVHRVIIIVVIVRGWLIWDTVLSQEATQFRVGRPEGSGIAGELIVGGAGI